MVKLKERIACIIPARSGSKRIKNKNLTKINKKHLVEFVFNKILKSKMIDDFYLATDKKIVYDKIGKLKNMTPCCLLHIAKIFYGKKNTLINQLITI